MQRRKTQKGKNTCEYTYVAKQTLEDDADMRDECSSDIEEYERTDEDVDDEDLVLTSNDVTQVLQTRFRGLQAVTRAQITWRSVGDPIRRLTQSPNIDTAQMQQALDAARQTRLQTQTITTHSTHLTEQCDKSIRSIKS